MFLTFFLLFNRSWSFGVVLYEITTIGMILTTILLFFYTDKNPSNPIQTGRLLRPPENWSWITLIPSKALFALRRKRGISLWTGSLFGEKEQKNDLPSPPLDQTPVHRLRWNLFVDKNALKALKSCLLGDRYEVRRPFILHETRFPRWSFSLHSLFSRMFTFCIVFDDDWVVYK